MSWRRATLTILLQVAACLVTLLSSSRSDAQERLSLRATEHQVDCTADDDEAVLLLVHGAILGGLGGYTIVRPPWQGEADSLVPAVLFATAGVALIAGVDFLVNGCHARHAAPRDWETSYAATTRTPTLAISIFFTLVLGSAAGFAGALLPDELDPIVTSTISIGLFAGVTGLIAHLSGRLASLDSPRLRAGLSGWRF